MSQTFFGKVAVANLYIGMIATSPPPTTTRRPVSSEPATPHPPDPAALADALRRVWGYESFRPLQKEAMGRVLHGRDSVVVLPTGGGKSLCFQAPALCLHGMALVVSPLISLMKDQVDALRANGVEAACLNSALAPEERRRVGDQIRRGELKLLYIAPERLLSPGVLDGLARIRVSLVAIDEAHCISAWGHDFRPEYRELRVLRDRFPDVGVHAYTATATEAVRQDIAAQLGLRDPAILVGPFDRPNLRYTVQRSRNRFAQVCEVTDRHPGESGIVYCISRREVERMAAALSDRGLQARPYHAGLSDEERHRNQDAFIRDEARIIVATVAFGMGIDKPDVRYVVHAGLPKSLENFQQESGRAGRDGLPAECCLFWGGGDLFTWRRIIGRSEGDAQEGALRALQAMEAFATSVTCRHQALVEHFGQAWTRASCEACDVCLDTLDLVAEPLILGQKILSCVARLNQRFGADYTAKVLAGSREARILDAGHDQLSTYGLLGDDRPAAIRGWIEQLADQGFLARSDDEYKVLRITPEGRRLLKGEVAPRLLQPPRRGARRPRAASDADAMEGVDPGLFEHLRALRAREAAARNVPAYVVFGDAALLDMARRRPTSPDAFLRVHGVGERKVQDFSDLFTGAIREYCQDHGIETDEEPAPRGEPRPVPMTAPQAFPYFREGRSVEEVAGRLGRAVSTTRGYLDHFIRHERVTDPSPWVDAATVTRIERACEEVGADRLSPIREFLGDETDYNLIRIVASCWRNRRGGP